MPFGPYTYTQEDYYALEELGVTVYGDPDNLWIDDQDEELATTYFENKLAARMGPQTEKNSK